MQTLGTAVRAGVMWQFVGAAAFALRLSADGGIGSAACIAAISGHWVVIVIVAIRRSDTPSAVDIIAVRQGFCWLLVVAYLSIQLSLCLRAGTWLCSVPKSERSLGVNDSSQPPLAG